MLGRHTVAARYFHRIASEITQSSVVNPLFLEQAAFQYLKAGFMRKFCFYMILAGRNFEALNLRNYSFNCFTLVHPYYQRLKWNGIRFSLYSALGRNSQNLGDNSLAVQFFRNLLQLCCEFDQSQEQKDCLNEFLVAVQNWTSKWEDDT